MFEFLSLLALLGLAGTFWGLVQPLRRRAMYVPKESDTYVKTPFWRWGVGLLSLASMYGAMTVMTLSMRYNATPSAGWLLLILIGFFGATALLFRRTVKADLRGNRTLLIFIELGLFVGLNIPVAIMSFALLSTFLSGPFR